MKKTKTKTSADFLKNVRIVGFDFDDTLVDEQYSIKQRWQKVLGEFSYLSNRLKKIFFKIYKKRGSLYKFHINDTLRELEIDEGLTKEIVEKFLLTTSNELLLKGALELIRFLKTKKMIVGIITDGKQSHQEGRIKRAGIYDFMDFIYYGSGGREQKPTKGLLKDCISRFSLKSPSEFLYVGNDYINDIVGMSQSGARTCLVSKEKYVSGVAHSIKVKNLRELLKVFRKYG